LIQCWINPDSKGPSDAQAYFDDIGKLEQSVVNLLAHGRYSLIVAYELETASREPKELGTFTLDNINDVGSIGNTRL